MTEPLGRQKHIRFGDEIASKVDLTEENKDNETQAPKDANLKSKQPGEKQR